MSVPSWLRKGFQTKNSWLLQIQNFDGDPFDVSILSEFPECRLIGFEQIDNISVRAAFESLTSDGSEWAGTLMDFLENSRLCVGGLAIPFISSNAEDQDSLNYLGDKAKVLAEKARTLLESALQTGPGEVRFKISKTQVTCQDILLKLIEISPERGISDIQLRAGKPPFARINGAMEPLFGTKLPISEKELYDLIAELMRGTSYFEEIEALYHLSESGELRPDFTKMIREEGLNFIYPVRDQNGRMVGRYRTEVFLSLSNDGNSRGLSVSMRNVPLVPLLPAELGFSAGVTNLVTRIYTQKITQGLILIVGPTGSGKTLTMSAILEEVNRRMKVHVVTFEEPVEILFQDNLAFFTQVEIGTCIKSFKAASKNSLRQNPNIIVYGEVRDAATAKEMLAHAGTGHLVVGTMHGATTTAKALVKLIEMTENPEGVASHLEAIVAQRLVPSIGSESHLGRTLVTELCRPTHANGIRDMLARKTMNVTDYYDKMVESDRLDSSEVFCVTFEQALFEKVMRGEIEAKVGYQYAERKDEFQKLARELFTKEKVNQGTQHKRIFNEFGKIFNLEPEETGRSDNPPAR